MATQKRYSSEPLITIAIALIVAVMTFLVGVVLLVPDGNELPPEYPLDELADGFIARVSEHSSVEDFPTPVPARENFTPTAPGSDYLDFRDGIRINLPSDVQHHSTLESCDYCPPLPIYTLMKNGKTISMDGNGNLASLDPDTDDPNAFLFLLYIDQVFERQRDEQDSGRRGRWDSIGAIGSNGGQDSFDLESQY